MNGQAVVFVVGGDNEVRRREVYRRPTGALEKGDVWAVGGGEMLAPRLDGRRLDQLVLFPPSMMGGMMSRIMERLVERGRRSEPLGGTGHGHVEGRRVCALAMPRAAAAGGDCVGK